MQHPKEKIESFIKEYLQSFNSGAEKTIELVDEKAVIEYPYYTILPVKMNRMEYYAQLSGILPKMGKFNFTDLVVYATDTPNTYWATVTGECIIVYTGKLYTQNYIVRFSVSEDMKITHYTEYGNPLRAQVSGLAE